jgi:hypothetical protein
MRRYRVQPITADSDSDWTWIDTPRAVDQSITVYEREEPWEKLPLLGPDGRPIEVYVGPDPIGFMHFEEHEE